VAEDTGTPNGDATGNNTSGLGGGAMPLDILERRAEDWIRAGW
jgi:uncharacterized protein (DUF885 family)